MDELINELKVLLADTVTLKFKAHGYHWNIEDHGFPQYHKFFQKIYEDYDEAIDGFAELIRKLGEYAPYKLSRFAELSSIPETDVNSDHMSMCADLLIANDAVTEKIKDAFDLATSAREQGTANFLADRQDMHAKWHWQLSSILNAGTEAY
jgi:starvation-inducible DNA-binding protein